MKKNGPQWSLFLDRDGVINHRLPGDYVKSWKEFKFLPHVLTALAQLRPWFKYVFIVTNQQGIGKGLMTDADVMGIHQKLKKIVRKHGGHIDEIFYCPGLSQDSPHCRKPDIGMGLQAKSKFPAVDFTQSVMIGDSASDITFGKNLGMVTVLIDSVYRPSGTFADYTCIDLKEFCLTFTSKIISGK
jgi:D-glycero-D-manno-heptose 1,7-bisphosphate phosphatase